MIVKMRFLNISGPRDDIDRVCEKYLSKYEMQIENAVTELKTTENIMPFVEVNPYRDPLAKAEQFAQLLPEDGEIRADLSGSTSIPFTRSWVRMLSMAMTGPAWGTLEVAKAPPSFPPRLTGQVSSHCFSCQDSAA